MTLNAARQIAAIVSLATFGVLSVDSLSTAGPPRIPSLDRYANTSSIEEHVKTAIRLQELNCTACHFADSLPAKRGPNLASAGLRLNRDWIVRFLLDPQQAHPQSTMPEMLHSLTPEKRVDAAEALASLIESQGQAFPELKASGVSPVPFQVWKQGDANRGRERFHQVGCVACHEPDEALRQTQSSTSARDALLQQLSPEEIADLGLEIDTTTTPSVALEHVANKYTPEGLFRFLLDPLAVRPSGRMPDCKLSILEAADIAAYLRARFAPADKHRGRPQATAGNPKQNRDAEQLAAGQRWFRSLNCNRCHDLPGDPPPDSPIAPLLAEMGEGRPCFTKQAPGHPRYTLTDATHQHFVSKIPEALESTSDARSNLHRQLLQFNCVACHARDKFSGIDQDRRGYFETIGNVDLGDEGRLPPPLDGGGGKLRSDWFSKVIAGKTKPLRPYMHARMPRFPDSLGNPLHASFKKVDAATQPEEHRELPKTKESIANGRKLLAVGCIQCHPIAGEALPGVVGVDLANINKRLHPSWFSRFLRNPGKIKPRTRMPSFFETPNAENAVLTDAEVGQQIAAMWHYLNSVTRENLPEPILKAREANYKLVPTDRPLLLRTFMNDVGTRAIAVGFPAGRHLAYDAEGGRPALLWKGDFLDAEGTWFVRFAPPAVPLGSDLQRLPPLFLLGKANAEHANSQQNPDVQPRYRGYTLDADGVPTFESDWGPWRITERWDADSNRMRRTVTVQLHPDGVQDAPTHTPTRIHLHQAESFQSTGRLSIQDRQGLSLRLVRPESLTPVEPTETAEGLQTWSLQLPEELIVNGKSLTLEVHYQW